MLILLLFKVLNMQVWKIPCENNLLFVIVFDPDTDQKSFSTPEHIKKDLLQLFGLFQILFLTKIQVFFQEFQAFLEHCRFCRTI